MDDITRERSKSFIDQNIAKTEMASKETSSILANLQKVYAEYSSVLSDLLQAKSKYISIVEKYLDNNNTSSVSNHFPGLLQTAAQFSQTEMEVDSKDMEQMANLVKELEFQKDSLEDQLERTFKASVYNIHQIEALSLQSSNYLDDLISEIGDIYGNSSMQQLVKKSI